MALLSSTVTSISTTEPSASQQQLPATPSTKSPFFTRLEQEHDACSTSGRTDSALSYASMITPSAAAQRASRQPPRPLSTPPAMRTASRAASHSVSLRAWKQWCKHSANNSDCDSVLSEPASYSSSARVCNDIWIVQNDVNATAPRYAPRTAHRARGREYHTSKLRRPVLKTRVAPPAYDAYDDDNNSSKLLGEFFSGCISPSLAPHNKRAMSEFEQPLRQGDAYYASARRFQQRQRYAHYRHVNSMRSFCHNEPCVEKKRFSARRLRWWLRKWTQKMRGQWEYNF